MKKEMLNKLQQEQELNEWAVQLSRKAKKGRFEELKNKGLVHS